MSIERIAPSNQFHPQNPNNPLQNAPNDRRSPATDSIGDGDGDGDGDIQMRSLDDRQPLSSACTLLVCFSFGFPIPIGLVQMGRANGPGSPLPCALRIAHTYDTSA